MLEPSTRNELIKLIENFAHEVFSSYLESLWKQWIKVGMDLAHSVYYLFRRIFKPHEVSVSETICGVTLDRAQRVQLANQKETELIKGFLSKKGNRFDAYLKMNSEGKIEFRFPDRTEKNDSLPPSHRSPVTDEYALDKQPLHAQLSTLTIYNKRLSSGEVDHLMAKGKTDSLTGFTTPSGKEFSGYLELIDKKTLKLTIEERIADTGITAIPKKIFDVALSAQHILALKMGTETGPIQGFRTKQGVNFNGSLLTNAQGRLLVKMAPKTRIIRMG